MVKCLTEQLRPAKQIPVGRVAPIFVNGRCSLGLGHIHAHRIRAKCRHKLGDFFWKVGDKKIIDGLGPDGLSGLARWGAARLSAMHTGYLYHYAFVILGAAAVFGAVILINVTGAN